MIDFPDSPAVDDIFTSGVLSWQWDGVKWKSANTATDLNQGEVWGNPDVTPAPAIPADLALMLRAALGDGTAGQAILSGGSGVDPAWGTVAGGGITVVSKTADYTVTTGDNGVHFDNLGASGDIVLTLPTPAAGLGYTFTVMASHYIRVNGTIMQGGLSGAYIRSNTPGNYLALEAHDSSGWIVSSIEGGWGLAV